MRRVWTLFINILFWSFFVISGIVLFVGAVIIRIVAAPLDPNRRVLQKYSCFWASLYIWVNPFWTVRVRGLEHVDPRKAYVMVSNHASMADILVIFRSFLHFKWVSKKSMFKVPLLGWNMWLNGYVPIERGDVASRERCMEECRQWLQRGSSIFFFPEGTRSEDGQMRDFKIGAFRLACETSTDILPVVIHGSRDALPKHSLIFNRKSDMTIEVLPSIPIEKVAPEEIQKAAKEMAEEVRALIAAALNREN